MNHKLSESLAELSAKTKTLEDNIAKIAKETKEKVDEKIAASKVELKADRDKFVSKVEEIDQEAKSGWEKFKKSVSKKVDQIKDDIQTEKEILEIKREAKKLEKSIERAEDNYEDSVNNALSAIYWANVAISEAEAACLEAYAAKLELEEIVD